MKRCIVLLIMACLSTDVRSQFKSCPEDCILLSRCPSLIRLFLTRRQEDLQTVRRNICGFENRRSKVCCPRVDASSVIRNVDPSTPLTLSTMPPTPPPPPPTTAPDGESLLPHNCGQSVTVVKIIGGEPTPFNAYPWMAALGYTEPRKRELQFLCAGSVITSRYVLTAAHCVNRRDVGRRRLTAIHIADWDLSTDIDCQDRAFGRLCQPPHMVFQPEDIVEHPMYNTRGKTSDDVALIRVNQPIDLTSRESRVRAVCLPPPNYDAKGESLGRKAIAVGWGMTEHFNYSSQQLHVRVKFAERDQCRNRFGANRFLDGQMCVGGEKGKDTCSGDSGGPLIVDTPMGPPYVQVGIVSYGPFPCGLINNPGVYADVSHYRNWILENIRP